MADFGIIIKLLVFIKLVILYYYIQIIFYVIFNYQYIINFIFKKAYCTKLINHIYYYDYAKYNPIFY